MDANLTAAIVSASSSALVAITALVLNNQRLNDMNQRIARVESKLDHIEELLVGYCLDVARIKERLDIK
jgi:hypothetical protein